MTKVLFVVAPQNFKDEEYYTPKALLEGKGFGVDTTSVSAKAISINGVIVDVNLTLDQAESADYQAIVFVGGPGADVYFNNQTAKNLASKFHKDGKVVAAICIAPSILANAGILNGKQATAFSSEQSNLKAQGAVYTGDSVTVDGKIITGRDPSAASEFGNEIVRAMGSL